jgi:hypothetical protein
VAVVEHARRLVPGRRLTVIVVTGHFFDDAVRRRMREARADFFYHRSEMAEAGALRAAVLRPDRARRAVPAPRDPEAQATKIKQQAPDAPGEPGPSRPGDPPAP